MRVSLLAHSICALTAAAALLAASGCARAPASGTSGVRLIVTLRFAHGISDTDQGNYHYFFLIRSANEQVPTNGPIPIVAPPYGNGFATGQTNGTGATAGFTDFVEWSRAQPAPTTSGYELYHLSGGINGDPNNAAAFIARGEPDAAVPPNGSNQLQFELNVGRLQPLQGEPDPNNGQQARYLQVNVVATTTIPQNPNSPDPNKFVDAFGDQHTGSGSFNSFITVDAAQVGRTYFSSPTPGDPTYEPDNDEFGLSGGSGDPAVEMTGWSVQIVGR